MRKRKKILSLVLAAVMAFSSIPAVTANAATTITWAEKPADGVTDDQPFASGTGGSSNFRIPCLVTLDDGTLVAACDARWNTGADGCGLDTIVSYSEDNGSTWNYTFANYLGDNGNNYHTNSSAFIDPAIATDGENVYIIADLYPAGVSINTGSGDNRAKEGHTGFDENHNLALAKATDEVDGISPSADRILQSFEYHLEKIEDAAEDAEAYYLLKDKDGNTVTGYTIDAHFNIKGDGVDTNLFCADSPYFPWPTDFLYMTKSSDGGKTWSAPTLLDLKGKDEQTLLVGPGRGTCTESGRIVFTCYEFTYTDYNSACIYSDDGGKTWERGKDVSGWSSEAVVTEADGRLYMFTRHGNCYYTSTDGGKEWSAPVSVPKPYNSNCQLTAITYSEKIDGKTAILFACPSSTSSRSAGKIYVGLLQEDGSLDWKYEYSVNGENSYAYSCITELNDGSIGLLYETSDIPIRYVNIDIQDIIGNGTVGDVWLTQEETSAGVIKTQPATSSVYTLNGISEGEEVTVESDNTDVVTVSVSDGKVTVLAAAGVTGLAEANITITVGNKTLVVPVQVTAAEAYEIVEVAPGNTVTYTDNTGYYVDTTDLNTVNTDVAKVTLTGENSNDMLETAEVMTFSETAANDDEEAATVQKAQLATAAATFNGSYVDIADCLYTFAAAETEGQYVISAKAGESTVYFRLGNHNKIPNESTTANVNVLEGSVSGTFKLNDVANSKYLHFYYTGNLHYDRCGDSCGTNDEFQLYKVNAEAVDSPIKGYEKITELSEITAGSQYLIVSETSNGDLYIMHPSTGNNAYNYVAKVVKYTETEQPETPEVSENGPALAGKIATAAGSFDGEVVNLGEYLYTFTETATAGQYVVSGSADGTMVYFNLGNGNKLPNMSSSANVTVLSGETEGTLKLKDVTNGKHLHFYEDSTKLYYDRCGNSCGANDDFLLFTPDESAVDSVLKGYKQITSSSEITSGGRYLIVRETADGCYYIMRPSTGTNPYEYVAKMITGSTTIHIEGVAVGDTSVTVGDVTYFIKVRNEEKSIALNLGSVKTFLGSVKSSEEGQNIVGVETITNLVSDDAVKTFDALKEGQYIISNNGAAILNEDSSVSGTPTGLAMTTVTSGKEATEGTVWSVKKADGGYTIQDANGKYVSFDGSNVGLSDAAQVLTIADSAATGGLKISYNGQNLNNFGRSNNRVAGYSGDDCPWTFYMLEEGVKVTAEKVGTTTMTIGSVVYTITVKDPNAVNKDSLIATITKAEEKVETDYTAESWTVFVEALKAAESVYNNEESTQKEINEANAALEAAIMQLEEKGEEPTPVVEGVIRLAGDARLETSRKVATALKETLGKDKFENIVVATSKEAYDALAGSYLAIAKEAPILLTNSKPEANAELLEYVNANAVAGAKIYILGGTSAVSADVKAMFTEAGYDATQLDGKNRLETNKMILDTAGFDGQDELVIVTSKGYADSLSASATGRPILLVNPDKELNADQKAVLDYFKNGKVYIIGGESAVSEACKENIETYLGAEITRVAGNGRYITTVEVAKTFSADADYAVVATGNDFPDGLCGGPLAAALGAPLLLTRDGNTKAADYAKEAGLTSGYVLGGDQALADDTVKNVFTAESIVEK